MRRTRIKIGEFWVEPTLNTLERGDTRVTVQPRAMDLLVYLAEHAGEVLSTDQLVGGVWNGRIVGDHAVYRLIKQLRDALGDDASRPRYIATVKKRGYRLIALVELHPDRTAYTKERARHTTPPNRWQGALLGGVALTLLAAFGWWLTGPTIRAVAPVSGQSIPVLVTEITSRPEDPDLADQFIEALEREFEDSQRFELAPPERINATLALMRRTGEPLSLLIGRELAARDESSMLVLEGSLRQVGRKTLIQAELIEPRELTILAEAEAEIEDTEDLMTTFAMTAQRIVDLAEDTVVLTSFPEPLERVTTQSFQALKLYSEAIALSKAGSHTSDVVELTHAALTLDPRFASAEILHAWMLFNTMREDDAFFHAERSLANIVDVTEEEALFIRGSVDMMKGDFEAAAAYFQTLADMNADHYWGVNNLAFSHELIGNRDLAARYFAARSDLLPDRVDIAAKAATALAENGDTARSAQYVERVRSLAANANQTFTIPGIAAIMAVANQLWAAGDYPQLMLELRDLEAELPGASLDEQLALSTQLSYVYLGLGRTSQARLLLGRFQDPAELPFAQLIGIVTGQTWGPISLETDDSRFGQLDLLDLIALARLGELDDAENQRDALRVRRQGLESETRQGLGERFRRVHLAYLDLAEAEVLLSLGDEARAEELIVRALRHFTDLKDIRAPWYMPPPLALFGAHSLAELREGAGDIDGAVEILERWGGSQPRAQLFANAGMTFWMRNRLKLSELLEDRDPARSAELRSELTEILAFGDEAHSIVRALHSP